MRVLLLSLVTAAVLAAPAGGATATGLHGKVVRSPATPVCQAETDCSAPAANTTLVFSRAGVTRSVTTDVQGRYSIRLAAGTWSVRIPSARFAYGPKTVTVRAGVMRTVSFLIDTGIR